MVVESAAPSRDDEGGETEAAVGRDGEGRARILVGEQFNASLLARVVAALGET